MKINKNEGTTLNRNPKRPTIGFRDRKKVGGILNEIISLVITAIMDNFDVSMILMIGRALTKLYT